MLAAVFYRSLSGHQPALEWIRSLSADEKLSVGTDLRTVQFGFPLGMPLCRSLGKGLYEVRTSLPTRREARILFSHEPEGLIILHGFIKKTQKTPRAEIDLALRRRDEYRSHRRN